MHSISARLSGDLSFRLAKTDICTHNLHTYPAKFIPQLAQELINTFSKPGDRIADIFAGSGTTNLEAMRLGRYSLALDVNPVASLLTRAKTALVEPAILSEAIETVTTNSLRLSLTSGIDTEVVQTALEGKNVEKLKYWFPECNVIHLSLLLSEINQVGDEDLRDILLLIFSSSLKLSSHWLGWSVKPQRDRRPEEPEDTDLIDPKVRYRRKVPYSADVFAKRAREVLKRYVASVPQLNRQIAYRPQVVCADLLNYQLGTICYDAVITSPPYLTSYEYADLHQLTAYWLFNTQTVDEFQKLGFIGTKRQSDIYKETLVTSPSLDKLRSIMKAGTQRNVEQYFSSMQFSFSKVHQSLKEGGYFCIVIGNSRFKGYEIANHQIFIELLEGIGFEICGTWERDIPNKRLTSLRHAQTGRILPNVLRGTENAIEIYPTEFILVARR